MSIPESAREGLLKDAMYLTMGERNKQYGPPYEHHKATAAAWSAVFGYEFSVSDVSRAFIIDKLVRISRSPDLRDSWADIAAYAGIGWECVEEEQ